MGLPIRENVGLVLRYGIEEATSTLTGSAANVTPGVLADIAAGSLLTSSVGYTLTYNTVDSQILPRDGEFVRLTQDFAGVGGDLKYIRTIGDARIYRQLN